jgi:hypothetical protein
MSTYDGVKWFFTAYDMDLVFGKGYDVPFLSVKRYSFSDLASANRVMHLIYQYDREALKARYTELRAGALSEDNVLNRFTTYINKIPKAVMDEEVKIWPGIRYTQSVGLAQIMNWYRVRLEYLDNVINDL